MLRTHLPLACLSLTLLTLGCSADDDSDARDTDASDAGVAIELDPAIVEQLEAELEAHRIDAGAPGMAVALVLEDQLVWAGGFGELELGRGRPVHASTPFRLASVSKSVLGVALLRAQELGLIDLDAPLPDDLRPQNPHAPNHAITLRELSQHRAGLIDGDRYECSYYLQDGPSWLFEEQAALCGATPIVQLDAFVSAYLDPAGDLYDEDHFAPAAAVGEYEYSNVGAALAGLTLDRAAAKAGRGGLEDLCEAEIFEPLGMQNTAWHRAELAEPDAVALPHGKDDGQRFVLPDYALATYPDGGLYASAEDLGRLLAAVVGGRGSSAEATVLSSASVDDLLDFRPVDDDIVSGQGVFWEHYLGLTGHTGGDPGVFTAIGYDQDNRVGYVILVNEATESTEVLLLRALDTLSRVAADL